MLHYKVRCGVQGHYTHIKAIKEQLALAMDKWLLVTGVASLNKVAGDNLGLPSGWSVKDVH